MKKLALLLCLLFPSLCFGAGTITLGSGGSIGLGGSGAIGVTASDCTGCSSSNDSVITEVNADGSESFNTGGTAYWYGWQFTVASQTCVTGAYVYFDGADATYTTEIWTDSAGNPGARVGAGYTGSVTSPGTTPLTKVEFLFAATQTLPAGTYWVVAIFPTANMDMGYKTGGAGTHKYSTDGSSWSSTSYPKVMGVLGCSP